MSSAFTGFLGLGIMGKGMVKNLITKFPEKKYIVWNRSQGPAQELFSQFPNQVVVAETPAEVISQSDITFSMLSNMEASVAVFDDVASGVISATTSGKMIVDCATLSPERMQQIAQGINDRGGLFLEAPVSGSKVPAETGQLIFLCGGSQELFDVVTPSLQAMGKASFYFGGVGQGSKVKLVVNMVMGTMMAAFADGLNLAQAADIPADKLLQVLDLGAMSNPMFRGKGPNMLSDNFGPHFPLKHAQKDMKLALDLASASGVSLPTSTAANSDYEKCLGELGDNDFSAVIKANQPEK